MNDVDHEREFTRLMGAFVAARLVYGPESESANIRLRDAIRYAEKYGEKIWDFTGLRAITRTIESAGGGGDGI